MDRVIVTKPMVGIFAMQVCACKEATNAEVLKVCNRQNPAGTSNGWSTVVRTKDDLSSMVAENCLPVQCADDAEREHLMVLC